MRMSIGNSMVLFSILKNPVDPVKYAFIKKHPFHEYDYL